jgi:hypothetical protein
MSAAHTKRAVCPWSHGLVQQILRQHCRPETVWPDEYDVGALLDEVEGEELLDQGPVAVGRPLPVEVGDGFEGAQAGVIQQAFEAATVTFGLLEVQQARQPASWIIASALARRP